MCLTPTPDSTIVIPRSTWTVFCPALFDFQKHGPQTKIWVEDIVSLTRAGYVRALLGKAFSTLRDPGRLRRCVITTTPAVHPVPGFHQFLLAALRWLGDVNTMLCVFGEGYRKVAHNLIYKAVRA